MNNRLYNKRNDLVGWVWKKDQKEIDEWIKLFDSQCELSDEYWKKYERADKRAKKWREESNENLQWVNREHLDAVEWRLDCLKQSKLKTYWKRFFWILAGLVVSYLILK